MFISRVKAKGQLYYYAYVYDGGSNYGKKTVYSFGKRDKAIGLIASWKDSERIPGELIQLGLKVENLDKWLEKIKAV